ncbi:MAG TPA: integrase core domain-containing protein, partial [Solirubrobacterales bacterium]|nr:integrase core domain-containing protein [Solirubrobacterales bacterium]HVQ60174.1 integrase core domain-containing protein [Solirubrobacterales bacterium]
HSWPDSAERTRALPSFLRYYNRRRPHSSLGDRPPIGRVHNVRG